MSLVRAPAALSVPGDILAGATAAGRPLGPRTAGAMASSVCLYWAGMALNDYADAAVDAVERPARPVPSGRVPRRTALAVATGLTGAGLGLAALSGGRRGLGIALPLTALIWAYDLKLKSTPAGPAAMAGARALDVLAGAVAGGGKPPSYGAGGGGAAGALARGAAPALLTGVHTYTLTVLSRHEISGAPARLPATTLAVSSATALSTVLPSLLPAVLPPRRALPRATAARTAVASAGVIAYLGTYGRAQVRAVRDPSAVSVRRAVGAGILALVPLQTALTARAGAPVAAALLGVLHPVAQRLARRVSPT
ncbi:UbiA family prenyltransferase [Streptomyces sp. ME02-8801-2C]|uniref:SCO3242 family prenyltransferase n=1 Tax=Streptomyces sp. ME02-8801-2C TaxID=3028680 RepID=UPI0029BF0E19|nr:UbiA family prenyltransferase [Streptomyces sp. ME02-8801-2C]MDX3453278.1 UbiA family prenyltransferase [Streptomyces sp. ME02-8801-2C]